MNSDKKVVVGLVLSLALFTQARTQADEKQENKQAARTIEGFWEGTLKAGLTDLRSRSGPFGRRN